MNGDREIPPYWRAAIKKGILTEKMYWKNVVPSQIAVGRAKERQRKRLIKEFLADLQKAWDQTIDREINLGLQAKFHYPINDNYHALKKKWEGKLKE